MAVDPQLTLRDMVRTITPAWLQGSNGYRLMYTFCLMLDALIDATFAAVKHSFPGLYSFESLPLIGKEARLYRGLFETDDSYALRLRRANDAHRRRGSVYELLNELYAFHAGIGESFAAYVIYRNGRRFSMPDRPTAEAADAAIVYDDISSWTPDTTPELWARQTVILRTNIYAAVPSDKPEILTRALGDLRSLIGAFIGAHMAVTEVIILGDASQLWSTLPGETGTWASSDTWSTSPDATDIRFTIEA
jgi:hypothetical protein